MTHICVGDLTIIGSDNGLSPGRRQAIIWTNAGILLIGPLGTSLSEISIEIHTFSFKKNAFKNVVCRMAAILSRPQCVKWMGDRTGEGEIINWTDNYRNTNNWYLIFNCKTTRKNTVKKRPIYSPSFHVHKGRFIPCRYKKKSNSTGFAYIHILDLSLNLFLKRVC